MYIFPCLWVYVSTIAVMLIFHNIAAVVDVGIAHDKLVCQRHEKALTNIFKFNYLHISIFKSSYVFTIAFMPIFLNISKEEKTKKTETSQSYCGR
jgi:hypothetical protein